MGSTYENAGGEANALAMAYAFLGNSLLRPMTQTAPVGLDAAFWESFPGFGDSDVQRAIEECAAAARNIAQEWPDPSTAIEGVSVEYTRLFIGPPSPAAAPWETFYRASCARAKEGESTPSDAATVVGFGQATFEMRALLRDAGLQLCNENNQYEDHLGIELLYLSELVRGNAADEAVAHFITTHPLSWIGAFTDAVATAFPCGYYAPLLRLVHAVLAAHVAALAECES